MRSIHPVSACSIPSKSRKPFSQRQGPISCIGLKQHPNIGDYCREFSLAVDPGLLHDAFEMVANRTDPDSEVPRNQVDLFSSRDTTGDGNLSRRELKRFNEKAFRSRRNRFAHIPHHCDQSRGFGKDFASDVAHGKNQDERGYEALRANYAEDRGLRGI